MTQAGPDNIAKDYYENKIYPEMKVSESQWENRLKEMSNRLNQIQLVQNGI